MSENITRRETLRRGLAATSLVALMSEFTVPALAQGDVDVPFTDYPANYGAINPAAPTRMYDIRTIDGMFTPKEKFFAINHFNRPEIDASAYKLKITGMVNKPVELSLTDLQSMAKASDLVAGYECSGNSPRTMPP